MLLLILERSSKITGVCKIRSRDSNLPDQLCQVPASKLVQQDMLISVTLKIGTERYQAGNEALTARDFVEVGIAGTKGARQAWKQRPWSLR